MFANLPTEIRTNFDILEERNGLAVLWAACRLAGCWRSIVGRDARSFSVWPGGLAKMG
jgi:hypothetical protein